MALHDTSALILDSSDAAPTLPDPVAVSSRTHLLVNPTASTVVWGSTGATPFTEYGANVATVSVARGSSKWVQSNGTRWAVTDVPASRRIYAQTGTTNASGDAVFTFTPPFPSVPVAGHAVQTALTDVVEGRITALSTTGMTVNVRRSPSVTILGISVLQSPQPAVGVTVHVAATEAGNV